MAETGIGTVVSFLNVGSIVNLVIWIVALVVFGGGFVWLMIRLLRFRIPVYLFSQDGQPIKKDFGGIKEKDGIKKLMLAKEKKKQVDNFYKYPIKTGMLKKTKDHIFLMEENNALKGIKIKNEVNFFDAEGNFKNADEVYFEDDGQLVPVADAELFTKDGVEVYSKTMPLLAPVNNDSNTGYQLELLDKINKYHIPSIWEKLQHFALIITGLMTAIIIVIITKYA